MDKVELAGPLIKRKTWYVHLVDRNMMAWRTECRPGRASNPRPGQEKKKKYEPPAPPPRVGKKQKKRDTAASLGAKLPTVYPTAKCKLRLLKLERIKDYLLMEEEFVQNQEQLKPQEERNEEDRSKVRPGSPLHVPRR